MKNIQSLENLKIKILVKLKKGNNKKSEKLFIIDGQREVLMAIKAKVRVLEIYCCPEIMKSGDNFLKKINNIEPTVVNKNIFSKISYKENPDGVVALAEKYDKKIEEVKLSEEPLVLVLEDIEKPGNLGAIIRTAYAAGVDLIIINSEDINIFNFNIIRASEGLLFQVPLVVLSKEDTFIWLQSKNIKIVTTETGASKEYFSTNMTKKVAIIFGSEAKGLSNYWSKKANERVIIPMKAGIDSLNISVAAAVMVFEAIRQRFLND